MAKKTAQKSLEVITIESTLPVLLNGQAQSAKPLPTGGLRHRVATVPTENMLAFEQSLNDEMDDGSCVTLFLVVSLPDRMKSEGLSYFALTDLMNSQKPPLPETVEGEDLARCARRWHDITQEATSDYGPDILRVELDGTVALWGKDALDMRTGGLSDFVRCTLYPIGDIVLADVNGLHFAVPNTSETARQILNRRNDIYGIKTPTNLLQWAQKMPQFQTDRLQGDNYPIHTSQEYTAFFHLSDDAPYGRYMITNDLRGSIRHQRPKATHSVELALLEEERDAGFGIEFLQAALQKLDADDKLIWLYVSRLIAPIEPLPRSTFAGGWVDLDDVAIKTLGGYARNPKEKLARREKVFHAIRMGARAEIIGQRSTRYKDKQTGEEIDTRIYTSPWKIMGREEQQTSLFAVDSVPLRVELAASREWTAITTQRDTAQYLPFGEIIGAIPCDQPSGAWARAVGLSFLHWCRCNIREALSDSPTLPTRRDLMDMYTSKKAPYNEVLEGPNPLRVFQYWHGLEELLRAAQLIEAPQSPLKPTKRQGWQDDWQNERPQWKPGPLLRQSLEILAQKKFVESPRQLNPAKQRRKPGRPRKTT